VTRSGRTALVAVVFALFLFILAVVLLFGVIGGGVSGPLVPDHDGG
jgi:hypothetical protein